MLGFVQAKRIRDRTPMLGRGPRTCRGAPASARAHVQTAPCGWGDGVCGLLRQAFLIGGRRLDTCTFPILGATKHVAFCIPLPRAGNPPPSRGPARAPLARWPGFRKQPFRLSTTPSHDDLGLITRIAPPFSDPEIDSTGTKEPWLTPA